MGSKHPMVSIIMPTYNSEQTIGMVLESIKNQTFQEFEVLVIDGGSTDDTRSIALSYGCTILANSKKLPEYAKHIGLLEAKGKYAMTLDSDEVLLSTTALIDRVNCLKKYPMCKNISSAGLINPKNYPEINNYIISYGEPFSYYMYGINGSNYIPDMNQKFECLEQDKQCIIYHFGKSDIAPICDGGGHFFDLEYLKKLFDINDIGIASQIFTVMQSQTHTLGIIKEDYIAHYSTTSIGNYLHKIQWRIINNVHHSETKAVGFSNRESSYPLRFRYKKILFIVYVFVPIILIYDTIKMIIYNKSPFYIRHIYFSYYTVFQIIKEIGKKLLGLKTSITTYGK